MGNDGIILLFSINESIFYCEHNVARYCDPQRFQHAQYDWNWQLREGHSGEAEGQWEDIRNEDR